MGSSFSCCDSEKVDQQGLGGGNSSWRMYTYKELHAATNGFHDDNKLGEGGFGSVYWGKTSDGLQIAVKKLKAMNYKAEMEFAVEVEVLARLRHKNLLGLRGYCVGTDQRLIVYDYMPNLSLLSHLHGHFASEALLDWKRRIKIALGSAEGILYLHQEVRPHIIHRDIKASNVLLDSDFEPLVADFGFAKLIPEGVSHMTTRVKGTLGYLAPEYAMWGKVSESCDVYSYGILLLELMTGRKPIERLPGGAKRTISEWVNMTINKDRFKDLADKKLKGQLNWKEFEQVMHLAIMCVQTEAEKRPTIKQVVECLKGLMADNAGNCNKVPVLMSIPSVKPYEINNNEDHRHQLVTKEFHGGDGDDQESFDYGVFSAIEEQRIIRDYPYNNHKQPPNFRRMNANQ
ncbi:PTI1-like tyrosine-protein kinase At3g15890 [Benincasa hispida]|uniref:PTI1-like tyrosine-protein kinase At3g15890 n=1 Tax=Benincasa hispida TaxID=102211 RepID=UPI0018FF1953|nr:PTI1-like tyrosine-protein kinase At3g15890 [Benincasa hispida]